MLLIQPEPYRDTNHHTWHRAHRARETQAYLAGQQIGVIHPWPAVSPDMSPIDHVWDILGRHIQWMNPAPQNNAKLIQSLTNAWNAIPRGQIVNIVNSMRCGCQAVTAAGGRSRY
ncbi:transposable element tcb1 transposase [Plakobranchus ocellatus]|uniref:Transposable element tcb1 transposase n=1 Tax=Plakobranchus ocellatus TaxID=259542 RepID=A0AAV4CKX5_9GAST|nr:transposable element tcb1 transposase [Plakobranchus ocellatus]